jgi:succinate dehydrogenase/fumarate reductase-like Fe-S protein
MTISKITVRRGSRDDRSDLSAYEVDLPAATTVLRALMIIAQEQDATLAFRIHRCYRGTCGSCSVRVNDRVVRACRRLMEAGEAIEVGPDPRYQPVRDLVVDFSERVNRSKGTADGEPE